MDALPWRVVYEVPYPEVALGEQRFDTRYRALVMGILSDHQDLHAVLSQAELLVSAGADAIDVVGVESASVISADEERDRVVPVIEAVRARFDVPISLGTERASVLRAALDAGAVAANDRSGFADPDYLSVAAAGGASVVATHIDRSEVDDLCELLRIRAEQAEAAGIPRQRVMIDAGLDLGRTEPRSLELLRAHDRLSGLGWPVVLSAPCKAEAAHAAHALGIALGCRILRAHDVKGARRTADVMAAVLEARLAS